MKKVSKIFAVLSLVMVMAAGSASAQKFHYGIKASATINDIFFDADTSAYIGTIEDNPIPRFNVGIFAEYQLTNRLSIAAEILYAQQGRVQDYEYEYTNSLGEFIEYESSNTITTHNLNIPILLKFATSDAFSVEFGPQIGFLLGGKYTKEEEGSVDGVTQEKTTITNFSKIEEDMQKIKSDAKYYNRVNIGLALGANYDFGFGMFIGARYTFGLTNTFYKINELGENYEEIKSKNSVFSVSVGYRF